MTLALDLGNSAAKGALLDGLRVVHAFAAAPAGLAAALGGHAVSRAGIASVVPAHTAVWAEAVREATGCEPLAVHAGLRLPFGMAYATPETLGADRLAAAAGAHALFPDADPLVVLDAGTALTLEVVAGGAYRGGAIAPGPDLLRRALARGTAQLPEVDPALPPSPIGSTTREAVQVGVMGGFVGATRGLLAATAAALGTGPFVVATGGWAGFLAAHLPEIGVVEPHLVLQGVAALVDLNA